MVQSMHVGGFEDISLINENVSVITKKYKYLSLDGVLFFKFRVDFSIFSTMHIRGVPLQTTLNIFIYITS